MKTKAIVTGHSRGLGAALADELMRASSSPHMPRSRL